MIIHFPYDFKSEQEHKSYSHMDVVMCYVFSGRFSANIVYCGQYANDGHIIAARWTAPLHYWSAGTVFVVLQRIPTKMTNEEKLICDLT